MNYIYYTLKILHNTLRPRQTGRHFPDYIFFNENMWFFIKILLNCVPNGQINNIPSLFQIMGWCRPGDKPLSEPVMVSLLMQICVTQPQWVKWINSPVTSEFPAQRPVTRSFDVFFDLPLNKRLSKQWWGWWFETPSHTLWHHCNSKSRPPWSCLQWWFGTSFTGNSATKYSCPTTISGNSGQSGLWGC